MLIYKELLDFEPGTEEFEKKYKELEEKNKMVVDDDEDVYWNNLHQECFDSHDYNEGLPQYISEEIRLEESWHPGSWIKGGENLNLSKEEELELLNKIIKSEISKVEKHILEDADVQYINSHVEDNWLYDTFEDSEYVYEAKKQIEEMTELQKQYCEMYLPFYMSTDDHREYTHHDYDDIKKTDKRYLKLIQYFCFKENFF